MSEVGQPSQQYLLQGSVLDESLEILLHRLQGISDDLEGMTRVKDHEIVYSMREANNVGAVSVRVRKSLTKPDQPFTLYYHGNPGTTHPTLVRTYVEVKCSQNVCSFLQELGFSMEYEFVSQGWLFRKSRYKATVTKLMRIISPTNIDQLVPMSKSHLVEVSTVSSSSNHQQAIDEVKRYAEQLKPLVSFETKT